jgi:hypothetical protein
MWRVLIPDDAPDDHARFGIPFCPVDLGPLHLPLQIEVELHNQLYHRRIASEEDARARATDIASAIRTALKLSVTSVQELYRSPE